MDSLAHQFYKLYGELLTPKLQEMLVQALKKGSLSATMAQVIIVVV